MQEESCRFITGFKLRFTQRVALNYQGAFADKVLVVNFFRSWHSLYWALLAFSRKYLANMAAYIGKVKSLTISNGSTEI